uniref:Acyl carrier protein n=1 Tax=Cryptomonas curvata TaxID=233186 RepID=A0A7S0MJ58_9CRYP
MLAATRAAAARLAPVLVQARCHPIRSGVAPAFSRCFSASGLSKDDVTHRVLNIVKNFQNVDPVKVTTSSHFMKDLGLDSLDTVEVVMAFEDEFAIEIPDAEAEKIFTVSAAVDFIAAHPQAK